MLKTPTLDLGNGKTVDWRGDLFAAIKAKVQTAPLADGKTGAFWINSAPRWAEGMPHLTTSYMLRGLKATVNTSLLKPFASMLKRKVSNRHRLAILKA